MKHLLILASIALLTIGAAACTREKPAETPPALAAQDITPAPITIGAATSVPSTTPAPTDTPVISPTVVPLPTVVFTPTAAPPPANTPTSVASAPSTPGNYTVQWGDTLIKIAGKYGVTTQAITAANPGLNPNYIVPGQVLVIPSPNSPGLPAATTGPAQPSPTAGSAQPPPAACTPTYTVQRGDWYYALARRFGISVTALLAANPSLNPNIVYPGQVLNIPCSGSSSVPPSGGTTPSGNTYVVRSRDTLFSIAIRYNTTVYALQIANNLPNPNFIWSGQVLVIPR